MVLTILWNFQYITPLACIHPPVPFFPFTVTTPELSPLYAGQTVPEQELVTVILRAETSGTNKPTRSRDWRPGESERVPEVDDLPAGRIVVVVVVCFLFL
jgi:hypothetical protein